MTVKLLVNTQDVNLEYKLGKLKDYFDKKYSRGVQDVDNDEEIKELVDKCVVDVVYQEGNISPHAHDFFKTTNEEVSAFYI